MCKYTRGCVDGTYVQLPETRLRHQRRLAVSLSAMVVVSVATWLPIGIVPLVLMAAGAGDDRQGGRWLLAAAVVAQSSVVSVPLMHVAGGRNFRRSALAFFLCHRQKVSPLLLLILLQA